MLRQGRAGWRCQMRVPAALAMFALAALMLPAAAAWAAPAGAVTNFTGAGISNLAAIAAGQDGNLWFTNQRTVGRITPAGAVTNYGGTGMSGLAGITAGPDGALWFTNGGNNSIGRITTATPVVSISGQSGPPGQPVTVTGVGFKAGESVTVKYRTGLSAPQPASVMICTATATAYGTFTCNASITGTAAGAAGNHKIVANGKTSRTRATTIFTLN